MQPRPHLLPQVLHIHPPVRLMALVFPQLAPAIARRVLATARRVPHTAPQVHHIPPLRRHLARLLVSRPLVQCIARQVHHTPLRVPTTTLKPLASNKALRVRFIALLVRWATHPQVLNTPLDRTPGLSVRPQAHQSGRLL